MATTKSTNIGQWNNFHNNGPFPVKILYETKLEPEGNMPDFFDRYNDAAREIQRLLKDTLDHHERFRAYGSSWSLSGIAHSTDRMHYNGYMNLKRQIRPDEMNAASLKNPDELFFFQCGNTIKEMSGFLLKHGKSLKTSGASNGQTIAGAISTGVHGSAFDTGAVQDYVVGLNLVIGPGKDDIVYIERAGQPVLSDAFAHKINSRVLRDDKLFNAALVGLGSFGFIHGVLIETEERFLLKKYIRKISRKDALELAHSLDFRNSSFIIQGETDEMGKGLRPYHFKVYLNPYNDKEDFVAEVIYKVPFRPDYTDPLPRIMTSMYTDLPTWIGKFASKHKWAIPKLIKALKGEIFPAPDVDVEGTLGEIFWDSMHQGPAFAYTLGVDQQDITLALDLFVKVVNRDGPVPGAMALRFIKASEATLAFTRFPITCIVEMDGILWKGNRKMISPRDMERKLIQAFMSAGIKFTIHWGKNADWAHQGLIHYMYGEKAEEWINYRSTLLSAPMAELFSNDFLDDTGLSAYRKGDVLV